MFKIVGIKKAVVDEKEWNIYDVECDDGEIIRDLFLVYSGWDEDNDSIIGCLYYRPDEEDDPIQPVHYKPTDEKWDAMWDLYEFMEPFFFNDEED